MFSSTQPHYIPSGRCLGYVVPVTADQVLQRGGAFRQFWPRSTTPTPSFETSPRVSGPSTADERDFACLLAHQSSPVTAPNVTRSSQLIPPIHIPDLTGFITRCSQYPVAGGSYGNIYKCIYRGQDGHADLVAVKAIRPQLVNDEVFWRELGIWKRLRHSNILKFIGTTSDFGPSVALIAPWIANGALTSFLNQNNASLSLPDRLRLLCDIAAGLNYLHTFSLTEDGHTYFNPVVHGDLTGTNVLVDNDRKAYLADFGLSGTLKQSTGMTYLAEMSCYPVAVRWAAPELLTGKEPASAVTTQSDIYSFGYIMLQVLTGNVPWSHLTNEAAILLKVVFKGEIHPRLDGDRVTDQYWNFITHCWSKTPTDRPSAKEALRFVDGELACVSSLSSSLGNDVALHALPSAAWPTCDWSVRASNPPWQPHASYRSPADPSWVSQHDCLLVDHQLQEGMSRDQELTFNNDMSQRQIQCIWTIGQDQCGFTAGTVADLMKHVALCHLREHRRPDGRVQCPVDGCQGLRRRDTILRHIREVHFGENFRKRHS